MSTEHATGRRGRGADLDGPSEEDSGDVTPPASDEEVAAALGALAAIETIRDETDTEERWSEIFRGIDEARPHRPLFEGYY